MERYLLDRGADLGTEGVHSPYAWAEIEIPRRCARRRGASTLALAMLILFVHGMGRMRFSAWPMLAALRRAGHITRTFSYQARSEQVEAIVARLERRLSELAEIHADVVAVGHSLGGVLLRAAIARLPAGRGPDS